ncbi:MAG: 50S ribosomal protein L21 [Deltaproteobacteria bacterium]|nr:MAG: 50S ribosomal protein L21 [Deltaproteobacteria bacterium]HDG98583.1 50S ribosomal protein L21 [Desulfobacterales bacterium]
MYAVIQTGGKQYKVAPGDEIQVEKLPALAGDQITFEKVLLASDGDTIKVGTPYVEGSKVIGRIVRQGKAKKIIVFKYKRRKNYKRKKGHRQHISLVRIEKIEA